MNPQTRRQAIAAFLKESSGPVTGADLAARFGVTRAVIVQDVALLRAREHPILATPQGYLFGHGPGASGVVTTQVAVHHGPDLSALAAELNAIVDEGAVVRDVIVEHPIYGELSGLLMLASRRDVQEFCRLMAETDAEPLSSLTDGVHLHTLEADDEAVFQRVRESLAALGVLLSDDQL